MSLNRFNPKLNFIPVNKLASIVASHSGNQSYYENSDADLMRIIKTIQGNIVIERERCGVRSPRHWDNIKQRLKKKNISVASVVKYQRLYALGEAYRRLEEHRKKRLQIWDEARADLIGLGYRHSGMNGVWVNRLSKTKAVGNSLYSVLNKVLDGNVQRI